MTYPASYKSALKHSARAVSVLAALAALSAGVLLSGCMMDPPGPSPIYSRLPADQSGMAATAQPLTPEERQRYDAIDHQVMAEQNQAIAAENAAQAYSRSYSGLYSGYYSPPVTVYGSYYGGGWGRGWGTGIGVGYGPYWGW